MPLTDYVNFFPSNTEATGGYNTGSLGLTVDDLLNASRAVDFQAQANTMGITPFEARQLELAAQNPNNVFINPATLASGVQTNPAVAGLLGPTNISATGTAAGMPANPFSGPFGPVGNLAVNALTGGYNYLSNLGTNQVALGNLPAGNVSIMGAGDQTYPSVADLISRNVDVSTITGQNTGTQAGEMGTTGYWPGANAYSQANRIAGLGEVSVPDVGQMNIQPGDITGIGAMPVTPVTVNASTLGGPSSFGPTSSLNTPTTLPQVNVPGSLNPTVTPSTVPSTTTSTSTTTTEGTATLPRVNVVGTQTPATGTLAPWLLQQAGYTRDPNTGTYTLPSVQVPGTPPQTTPTTPTTTTTGRLNFSDFSNRPAVGPFAATTTSSTATSTQTTASSTATSTANTITFDFSGNPVTYNPNAGTVAGGGTGRNFQAELEKSLTALQLNQPGIMGMYNDIYQNLLGQTMLGSARTPGLTAQLGNQLTADQAKLQRAQSGYLNAEDVRQAQQGAREAYAARGQLMGPGAVGAEILNREAIRQQREDQARAGYNASVQNALNATQLQTGNIFSPIGNLVQNTFNPLGQYPQDVYNTNYNAQLARDISAANNAAAIEAAKYGAAAQQRAAVTSAGTNLVGNLLVRSIFG
jgi:hypothetical protein